VVQLAEIVAQLFHYGQRSRVRVHMLLNNIILLTYFRKSVIVGLLRCLNSSLAGKHIVSSGATYVPVCFCSIACN